MVTRVNVIQVKTGNPSDDTTSSLGLPMQGYNGNHINGNISSIGLPKMSSILLPMQGHNVIQWKSGNPIYGNKSPLGLHGTPGLTVNPFL